MSGGFFRGTSADQDTRFSNKQAKLLKSQKFAPELDHLVDTTKVKMDVIRPWIATRVTELLGFEDEVLINFIYGLLDGKEVNGKEIQISLTGFMEKNTGKFMKELWTLLISAQKAEKGIPPQLLDAKAEEVRKKKAEVDRITTEIMKKKERESREVEEERLKKLDGGAELKATDSVLEPIAKRMSPKSLSAHPEDKAADEQNGVGGRSKVSSSPHSIDHSPSFRRDSRSRSRSKSFSNSRSHSRDIHKSKSPSRSPRPRGRSISSDRLYRSPRRRSITPRHRGSPRASISPSRRRSTYFKRRSRSPWKSPSPLRRKVRSPYRRRSPSPIRRRRSPSPIRRRRSPSPTRRRRSPSIIRRRRHPLPLRRRSPLSMRHRSPSPGPRRSPSPRRRRSPSPRRRRSPSPGRRRSPSPSRRRPPLSSRRRSVSPRWRKSLSPNQRRSLSPNPQRSLSRDQRSSPSPDRQNSPFLGQRKMLGVVRRRSLSSKQDRSPSPLRRRSPSPMRRISPSSMRRRSPAPVHHRSSSPVPHRSMSPIRRRSRSPVQQQQRRKSSSSPQHRSPSLTRYRSPKPGRGSTTLTKGRSPSPCESSSPSLVQHRSATPVRKISSIYRKESSPLPSSQERKRSYGRSSMAAHLLASFPRSPQRNPNDKKDLSSQVSASSLSLERSPQHAQKALPSENRSPYESGTRQTRERIIFDGITSPQKSREQKPYYYSSETSGGDKEANYTREDRDHISKSPNKRSMRSSIASELKDSPGRLLYSESKKDIGRKSEKSSGKGFHHEMPDQQRPPSSCMDSGEGLKSEDRNRSSQNKIKDGDCHKSDRETMSMGKAGCDNKSNGTGSGSEESNKHRAKEREKRKHKRSKRREMASDEDSCDSEVEDKKEAKRRRREEKKQRKEEKRRRREERRRRKEERRAEKRKVKIQNYSDASDSESIPRRGSHLSDNEETESEQKKLEIVLRNRALESLKAKKGVNR